MDYVDKCFCYENIIRFLRMHSRCGQRPVQCRCGLGSVGDLPPDVWLHRAGARPIQVDLYAAQPSTGREAGSRSDTPDTW